jgi:hypothetical protein
VPAPTAAHIQRSGALIAPSAGAPFRAEKNWVRMVLTRHCADAQSDYDACTGLEPARPLPVLLARLAQRCSLAVLGSRFHLHAPYAGTHTLRIQFFPTASRTAPVRRPCSLLGPRIRPPSPRALPPPPPAPRPPAAAALRSSATSLLTVRHRRRRWSSSAAAAATDGA